MFYRDDLGFGCEIANMTAEERLKVLREVYLLGLPPKVILAITAGLIFVKKM